MNQFLELKNDGPINHRIEIYTVKQYLEQFLALNFLEISEIDWLTIPEQRLLEFTSGKVFYDNFGELTHARERLNYFPDSIWKLKLIAQWDRISQEMVFVGRTGGIGDDLGSRIEASRLVKYIMEMAFILEKKYIPYEKWFSLAFRRLSIAPSLEPILIKILNVNKWQQREKLLCDAYIILAKKHVELGLIDDRIINIIHFHNRPQLIIPIDKIVNQLKDGIKFTFNPIIYQLGTVNQFISISNNLKPRFCKRAQNFYK
jgi:hypothetical protein